MGIFNFGGGKIKQLQSQINTLTTLLTQRSVGTITLSPNYTLYDNADRYCTTDDVYSIVRLLSTTAAMIPFYAYSKDNQGELIDLPDDHPLNMLLENPFEGMSKFESFQMVYMSLYTFGEAILYKEKPALGPNGGKVKQLHFLYPHQVQTKITTTFPQKIVFYEYVVNGVVVFKEIPPEDIIHIKYQNLKLGVSGQELRGLSPLDVLGKRLTQTDAERDVTIAQLQNGGVPGIVSDKLPDDTNEVANARKNNYYKFTSNTSNKGQPFWDNGDLQYIPIGSTLVEMDVQALSKITFKKLCNAFGVSDTLFNNDTASTESNVQIMMKRLYTNTILPDVIRVRDGLNKGLVSDGKLYINYDISEVPELQDNYKDMVQWLSQAYWLTPNEKRAVMKYDAEPDPLFDSYLLPTGIQTIEDLMMPDPVQNTGDYNNQNQ
jgi:HK97 family phage portal protein